MFDGLIIVVKLFHKPFHHFPEQAFRPVPQENSLFVEQAGKPVADNRFIIFKNRLSGLFHKKIHSLWNRPESLLLTWAARYNFQSTYFQPIK
ncbi:MAG: hypothetical protein EAZ09_08265 [Oscillatoriales cyanobacterium]|nr:MAG: hypothetical protein EAZ18_07300 [Oscillatoriales cyanobacterium]TAH23151.1 MAG: hypothetical protein EAZ09_08265 [Oscillatoriales cyanobacterium]